MSKSDPPDQRDPAVDYAAGIKVYLDALPKLLAAEQGARDTYDPQRVQSQIDLEKQFDPTRSATRTLLQEDVLKDLQAGYGLPADLKTQTENDIRGAQTARGNYLGNGAVTAEAAYKGKTAIDLYNRRLANAGTVLSQPSVATPDRTAAYTVGGFNAGPQGAAFGQQAYQNSLAGYNATPNPWATALGGAASGAAAGSSFGPYGAVAGAVIGGVGGYFASDERLKENIEDTGSRHCGIRVVDFNFKGFSERWRGVVAQEVERIIPSLVLRVNGTAFVNYDKLGIKMRRVG